MSETGKRAFYYYLLEVETREHRYVMIRMKATGGAGAKADAKRHLDGFGVSIVACSKDAPEFGDTCRRELVG